MLRPPNKELSRLETLPKKPKESSKLDRRKSPNWKTIFTKEKLLSRRLKPMLRPMRKDSELLRLN